MANWYGSARSNYFKVKDVDKFETWAGELGLTVISRPSADDGLLYGLLVEEGENDGAWPAVKYTEDPDLDMEEVDVLKELSAHLAEGEVAILMECGAEKLRYLTGWAQAINSKGEVLSVMLNDIYQKVEDAWGVKPTEAEY